MKAAVSVLLAGACLSAWPGRACAAPGESVLALVAKLRGSDPAEADRALEALLAAGPEARKRATLAVTDLVPRRRRLLDAAHKRLATPFRFLQDEARTQAVLKGLDRLAAAGQEALAFAFDKERYPVPAQAFRGWMPGRDHQEGQVLLEGRVEVAVGIFNRFESDLVRLFGFRLVAKAPGGGGFGRAYLKGTLTDSSRPLRPVKYTFTDAGPTWARIGAMLTIRLRDWQRADQAHKHAKAMAAKAGAPADKAGPPPPAAPPIALAAAALFAGKYDQARTLRPAAGPAARFFDVLVRRHVLVRNAKARGKWSRQEKQMMHLLNLYRLSLGLDPLVANPKLHAAAKEHSQWQARRRQITHVRPEPDKRTVWHRCRAQGYRGAWGENISAYGGTDAIWAWRSDAAHHRSLLSPSFRAAGIGQAGEFATYNAGGTIEDAHLAALLKPAARAKASDRPGPSPR